jgi:hypothetical protein
MELNPSLEFTLHTGIAKNYRVTEQLIHFQEHTWKHGNVIVEGGKITGLPKKSFFPAKRHLAVARY